MYAAVTQSTTAPALTDVLKGLLLEPATRSRRNSTILRLRLTDETVTTPIDAPTSRKDQARLRAAKRAEAATRRAGKRNARTLDGRLYSRRKVPRSIIDALRESFECAVRSCFAVDQPTPSRDGVLDLLRQLPLVGASGALCCKTASRTNRRVVCIGEVRDSMLFVDVGADLLRSFAVKRSDVHHIDFDVLGHTLRMNGSELSLRALCTD